MLDYIQKNYNKQNNIKFDSNASSLVTGKIIPGATDALGWGIKKIETGGVLVDFCFVDIIGMVMPRTYQAFTRNREELDGKLNVKNGIEELIREIFSGPSMFVIPMIFIAFSKKLFGAASNLQFKTLEAMTDSFKGLLKKDVNTGDKTKLKEDFYRNILNETFENHRNIKLDNSVNIDEEIEKIVKKLSEIETGKKPAPHIAEIKRIVPDLNKSHGLHLDNSHNLTLKNGLTKEIGALISDLTNYSKDIVEKFAEEAKGAKKEFLPALLKKLHKFKVNGRRFILVSTVLATTAFLYSIPIMYKRNRQFPGIDGLVKDKNTNKSQNEVPRRKQRGIYVSGYLKQT